jgi:competence protein ComEA
MLTYEEFSAALGSQPATRREWADSGFRGDDGTAWPARQQRADGSYVFERARKRRLILMLFLSVLLALGLAWFLSSRSNAAPKASSLESLGISRGSVYGAVGPREGELSGQPSPASPGGVGPTLGVHVAGAVSRPGVYYLREDSRVVDCLEAAGGPLPEADLEKVNLAALVSDGDYIYIPRQGEQDHAGPVVVPSGSSSRPSSAASATASKPAGKINVNRAFEAELETLPGIGPALAQRIVEVRNSRGRFSSLEDLRAVPGIGTSKIAQLAPYVTF